MKSKSYDHLATSYRVSSISIHKSLPDLSFISQYSKELSQYQSILPLSKLSTDTTRTISSPTLIQQQKIQDFDRRRTLKSIKRYKNNKHSTEPLGIFYSPQLRKNRSSTPTSIVQPSQILTNRILCLNKEIRANSCDIQSLLKHRQSSILSSSSNPQLINNIVSSHVQ